MVDSDKVLQNIEDNQLELEKSDVVSKVLFILEKLNETPINEWEMNRLVDYVFTLDKLMYNIGDLKDYSYARVQALGEEYKSAVRDKYIELKQGGEKMTDTMAKSLAEKECDDIKEQELEADHKARYLRSLYDACDKIISFTQTKAKTLVDTEIRSMTAN